MLFAVSLESSGDIVVAPKAVIDAEVAEPSVEVVAVYVDDCGVYVILDRDDLYAVNDRRLVVLIESVSVELRPLFQLPFAEIAGQGVVDCYGALADSGSSMRQDRNREASSAVSGVLSL